MLYWRQISARLHNFESLHRQTQISFISKRDKYWHDRFVIETKEAQLERIFGGEQGLANALNILSGTMRIRNMPEYEYKILARKRIA